MPLCLTLSNIRYGSRVKWSNPGKGVAPSPTPWCSKLSKREPSGHPRLWSPTLLLLTIRRDLFSLLRFTFRSNVQFFSCLYYYYYSLEFSHQSKLMVFHWRLSDSKSPQVSRTLLSILAIFNNAVVWMVFTRPPTSKSSRTFNNPLLAVPKAPIIIGIIVTFIFHSFFFSIL